MKNVKPISFAFAASLSALVLMLAFQNCSKYNSGVTEESSLAPFPVDNAPPEFGGSTLTKAATAEYVGPSGSFWQYKLTTDGDNLSHDVSYRNDALEQKTGSFSFKASKLSKTEFSCLTQKVIPVKSNGNNIQMHFVVCWDPLKERLLGFHRTYFAIDNSWSAVVVHPIINSDGKGEISRIVRTFPEQSSFWAHQIIREGKVSDTANQSLTVYSIEWNPKKAEPIHYHVVRNLKKDSSYLSTPLPSDEAKPNILKVSYLQSGVAAFDHYNKAAEDPNKIIPHIDIDSNAQSFSLNPAYTCSVEISLDGQPLSEAGVRAPLSPGASKRLDFKFKFSGPIPTDVKVNYFNMFFIKDQYDVQINKVGSMIYGPLNTPTTKTSFSMPTYNANEYGYYNVNANLVKIDRNGERHTLCHAGNLVVLTPVGGFKIR